ncbi:MAG: peptide chain release factor N(5)-glutamine methyltransferase [Prevotella sp.]|nr:peptide chain release factor N(5)-glutamine methyltransferase [Staphylococcus sp.]MCM1350332.1 peptide chain release factor N(5)-glutamine methyltransferase [Prevotella sp.]
MGLEKEAVKLLVLELSGMDGATFFANLHSEIPENLMLVLEEAIPKYLEKRIPVQHIIGYSYFYGYKIKVNPQVLIPRPETEELVSYVLQMYDQIFQDTLVDVVDIGTGSGAIAIALAKEEPHFSVVATDISHDALEVAKENALCNEASVTFLEGDMIEPLMRNHLRFDILVSNPPYIPDDEYVEDMVKKNEPNVALFGGVDGMHFYEIILSQAHHILKENNIILFEHSHTKKKEMIKLANQYFPNGQVEVIQDLNGKDRFTIIVNHKI